MGAAWARGGQRSDGHPVRERGIGFDSPEVRVFGSDQFRAGTHDQVAAFGGHALKVVLRLLRPAHSRYSPPPARSAPRNCPGSGPAPSPMPQLKARGGVVVRPAPSPCDCDATRSGDLRCRRLRALAGWRAGIAWLPRAERGAHSGGGRHGGYADRRLQRLRAGGGAWAVPDRPARHIPARAAHHA